MQYQKMRQIRKKILFGKKSIMMDDEKYFTITNDTMGGNEGYYSSDKDNVPNNVCLNRNSQKNLIWEIVSKMGCQAR
jgi:hypothetical protein